MSGIVYDAGALIAGERNNRALWADHRVRLEQGTIPVTPAAVVAQVSRSLRQAQLRLYTSAIFYLNGDSPEGPYGTNVDGHVPVCQ